MSRRVAVRAPLPTLKSPSPETKVLNKRGGMVVFEVNVVVEAVVLLNTQ